jgi:hypothetical protein
MTDRVCRLSGQNLSLFRNLRRTNIQWTHTRSTYIHNTPPASVSPALCRMYKTHQALTIRPCTAHQYTHSPYKTHQSVSPASYHSYKTPVCQSSLVPFVQDTPVCQSSLVPYVQDTSASISPALYSTPIYVQSVQDTSLSVQPCTICTRHISFCQSSLVQHTNIRTVCARHTSL